MDDQTVSGGRHFVVLMVDDDEDDWVLVKQAFTDEESRYDFEIDLRHLEDGVELLEYLNHCRNEKSLKEPMPDLILLDLNMPAMGGMETLKNVKSHPICRRIPIIVFTTSANYADVIECYQCGGNAFIQKPSDYQVLREMIHGVVNYWLCTAKLPNGSPSEYTSDA